MYTEADEEEGVEFEETNLCSGVQKLLVLTRCYDSIKDAHKDLIEGIHLLELDICSDSFEYLPTGMGRNIRKASHKTRYKLLTSHPISP